MTSSFEKSVKGGTKIKLAPPKSKYVEHILVATHAGEAGVAEVFRALAHRLRDSTWTIVFKGLIIVHLMIREGEPNVTLRYLADQPSKLAISNFSDVQEQGGNIRHYYNYVLSRAKAYRDTKLDWVRDGQGRLKRQAVDKGLLRETETVQKQIAALLKCDLLSNDPENEITLTAFRLLTMDLLILFHVMNEGTINVLEHYFEMSKYDAERALAIYKTFSRQTNDVVEFLGVARLHESATRLEIPKLKHAPTSLTASLEEYLNDPDFEINRRQYLAQQEAKKSGKFVSNGKREATNNTKKSTPDTGASGSNFPEPRIIQNSAVKPESKAPAPDLIDFFGSIEQSQQPMLAQPQQQISSIQIPPQLQYQQQNIIGQPSFSSVQSQQLHQPNGSYDNSNLFAQTSSPQRMQQPISGTTLGNYSQQPQYQQQFLPSQPQLSGLSPKQAFSFSQQQQQQPFATGQPQQSTNPFRQSVFPDATLSSTPFPNTTPSVSSLSPQTTNPFARHLGTQQSGPISASPFTSPPPLQTQSMPPTATDSSFFNQASFPSPQSTLHSPQIAQPLQFARTGTNPFAHSAPQSESHTPMISPLAPHPTGSTNPFRKSVFVNNQSTGQGWPAQQGTMGGLEQMQTIPVFPRPGQPPQQQAWP